MNLVVFQTIQPADDPVKPTWDHFRSVWLTTVANESQLWLVLFDGETIYD